MVDEVNEERLKTDRDYIRLIGQQALQDLLKFKTGMSILFGTQEGSIGSLIEIPEKAYKFMELIESVMEKEGITNFGKISRKDFRTAKTDSFSCGERRNVIDGNFIEILLDIDAKQQLTITGHLMLNTPKEHSQSYLKEIKTLIEFMRDKHWIEGRKKAEKRWWCLYDDDIWWRKYLKI